MPKRKRLAAATEHHLPLKLCVPYLSQAHLLRQLSRRWRDVLAAPGAWTVGLRPGEVRAVPALGAHHARARDVATLARLPTLAPHLRRLELRIRLAGPTLASSLCLAPLRRLEALRIDLPEVAGCSALTQLKQLLRGARPLKRLRQLEVDLPQAFAFPCWLEWQQLPASLEALSGNLPLRLEALPAGRLKRVEVTRKVCVAAGGGWIRTVRPRVWSLEGGDMHNKGIIM